MDTRQAQNAAFVHFNPWIVRCVSSIWNCEVIAKKRRPSIPIVSTAGASRTEGVDQVIRIRITRWTGLQSDGVLFAACGPMIRAAIPGYEDAEQFWCRDGHWFSEDGESVEIEFFAAESHDYEFPKAMMTDEGVDSSFWSAPAHSWVQ